MLIKIKPHGMDIQKGSLSGMEAEFLEDYLDNLSYEDVIVHRQTDSIHRIQASPDICYGILYRVSAHFDIELM